MLSGPTFASREIQDGHVDKFFDSYQTEGFFDEMFSAPGQVRPHYGKLLELFQEMDQTEFAR